MERGRDISVYRAVRDAERGLVPHIMSTPAVLDLTRMVEAQAKEDAANAEEPSGVIIGFFQKDVFFTQSERHWQEIAADVECAMVVSRTVGDESPGILRVATGGASLDEEWAVLYCEPGSGTGIVARELPGARRALTLNGASKPCASPIP